MPPITDQVGGQLKLYILPAHELFFNRSHIHRTPLLTSTALNGLASKAVQDAETVTGQPLQLSIGLKAENLQRIGAFKVRL